MPEKLGFPGFGSISLLHLTSDLLAKFIDHTTNDITLMQDDTGWQMVESKPVLIKPSKMKAQTLQN